MSEYRRAFAPGGMFFFTLVTHQRRKILCEASARSCLKQSFLEVQRERPFEIVAIVLLPEHLHCLWQLPTNDADFSTRWGLIKARFTKQWLARGGIDVPAGENRALRADRGVWQRRFWEHTIRDDHDYQRHLDYIHFNPVKHGLARCPHEWTFSSFHRWVNRRVYSRDWQCSCKQQSVRPPDFEDIQESAME